MEKCGQKNRIFNKSYFKRKNEKDFSLKLGNENYICFHEIDEVNRIFNIRHLRLCCRKIKTFIGCYPTFLQAQNLKASNSLFFSILIFNVSQNDLKIHSGQCNLISFPNDSSHWRYIHYINDSLSTQSPICTQSLISTESRSD